MLDRRFFDVNLVVQGVVNEPAANPTKGTQYIIGENPTGDFENAEAGQLARYNGSKWIFSTLKEGGLEVINAETGEIMSFDGMFWEPVVTLGGSSSNSSSVIVVEDLATVVTSSDNRPEDYIFNYCIVDNGVNTPSAYEYYAHDNSYDEMSFYDGYYGSVGTRISVNSILAGDNGKYYTLKTAKEYESLIEASEMAVGTLVLNKKCNLLYQYNGSTLELVNGNSIDVNYVGLSDSSRKWSNTDYWKHFGETGLYLYEGESRILSPDATYDEWRTARNVTVNAGDFFASNNHCMLYYCASVEESNQNWIPVAFLKKGTFIYSQYDNSTYVSNGVTLEKISKDDFLVVDDICKIADNSNRLNSDLYNCNLGDRVIDMTDKRVNKYTDSDYENCEKDYDLTDGVKIAVLGDAYSANTPCIYEYFADGTGNIEYHSYFSRYNLAAGTLIFNERDKGLYYYDGTTIIKEQSSSSGNSVGAASEVICETHTLTAAEATAKSFTLANSIMSGKETDVFLSVCGVVQIAGVDYTASGNSISWDGKSLDEIVLQAGDVFLVQYVKA